MNIDKLRNTPEGRALLREGAVKAWNNPPGLYDNWPERTWEQSEEATCKDYLQVRQEGEG